MVGARSTGRLETMPAPPEGYPVYSKVIFAYLSSVGASYNQYIYHQEAPEKLRGYLLIAINRPPRWDIIL